jgi:MFS family permease
VLTLAGVEVGWLIGTYGVSIWLPLIIKTQNFSDLNIGFLTAIPAGVSCIVMLIWARAVDRSGRKINNLAAMLLVGGLGLVLAGLTTHIFVVSFIGLAVSIVGTNAVRTVFWTIPSRFLSGIGMASGFAFINAVGTLGSFIGTFIVGWLKGMTNSYSLGMIVMAFFLFLAALLSLSLKLFIRRE